MPRPPRIKQPWRRQPRRPLTTLPGVAVVPLGFGPAMVIGGFGGLLRDAGAFAVLADVFEILTGLIAVVLVVLYVLRPTSTTQGKQRC